MKKTNKLLFALLIVVFVVSSTALIACQSQITVTLKDGETTLSTITLGGGETLPRDFLDQAQAKIGLDANAFRWDGWVDENCNAVTVESVLRGNVVLNASYTRTHFVVKLVAEGSAETTVYVPVSNSGLGSNLTDPVVPADKEFGGWFNGETLVTAQTPVTEDVTLTAKFTDIPKATVTLKVGEEVVGTIMLKVGETLSEEQLAQPEQLVLDADEFQWEGWFNGETLVTAQTPVNGDVTLVAQAKRIAFKVTFVAEDNEDVVKYVSVAEGIFDEEHLVAPENAPFANGFDGWYLNGQKVEIGTEVTENCTVTARFVVNAWVVTFVDDGETAENAAKIAIPMDGNGKIVSANVPAAKGVDGKSFLGWFDESLAQPAEITVSQDVIFTARYVSKEDYAGAWINDEQHVFYIINAETGSVTAKGNATLTWEFNEETGTWGAEKTAPIDRITAKVLGDKLIVEHYFWDSIYEEFDTEIIQLEKFNCEINGSWHSVGGSEDIVIKNGIVLNNIFAFGYARVDEENGKIIGVTNSSYNPQPVEAAIVIEENGNIVQTYKNDSKIFVKDATSATTTRYSSADPSYSEMAVFNEGATIVFRLEDNGVYTDFYATVEGTVAEGELITVSYGETSFLAKIVGKEYVLPGAEKGTFTCESAPNLVLDGFGGGMIGEEAISYTVSGSAEMIITDVENSRYFKVNEENHTYEVATPDGFAITSTLFGNSKYTLTLDGFGTAILLYTSYSSTTYNGTYTVDGNVITLTVQYSYNGRYRVEEITNGVALVGIDKNQVFIQNGATVESKAAQFNGTWESNGAQVVINCTDSAKEITYQGTVYTLTSTAYDDSTLTFKGPKWASETITSDNTYKLTVVDGNLVLTVTYNVGYDDVYEEYITETATVTYTKVVVEDPTPSLDAFAGTWTGTIGAANTSVILTFDGQGNVTITRGGDEVGTFPYTISGNVASFQDADKWGDDWTATLNGEELSVVWCQGGEYDISGTLAKQAEEPAPDLDAFAGTWTGNIGACSLVLVFDGQGKVTITKDDLNMRTVAYTISGSTATFTDKIAYYTWTAIISGTTMSVSYEDDDYYTISGTATKQA